MRVLCFGVSLIIGGGVSQIVVDYYKRLNHSKIVFDFEVFENTEQGFADEVLPTGSRIFYNCTYRDGLLRSVKNKYRHIKESGCDAIYTHLGDKAVVELLFAKLLGVKKRVVHSHNACERESRFGRIRRKLCSFFVRNLATDMFACSREAGEWAYGKKACLSERFHVINNGINLIKFTPDKSVREFVRNSWDLSHANETVIGCVGRFSNSKNHEFLLDVFDAMLKINSNIRLVLIGDGPERIQIENKIKALSMENKVRILGVRPDVDKLLNGIDIFVLPTRYEGLGIVFIEAQAMGIPCYGTKEGVPPVVGVSELMHFMSLSDSPKHWAETILSDCEKKCNDSVNTHEAIRKAGFDIDAEAHKLEELLLK